METEYCGHIFVPTDFSSHALAAFRRACELARAIHARVSLLHVTDAWFPPAPTFGLEALSMLHSVLLPRATAALAMPGADWRKAGRIHAYELRLREWARQPFADEVPIQTFVRTGRVGDEIVQFIAEQRVTLAILGVTAGRPRWSWMRKRLVDVIARRASTSVMLVPGPQRGAATWIPDPRRPQGAREECQGS